MMRKRVEIGVIAFVVVAIVIIMALAILRNSQITEMQEKVSALERFCMTTYDAVRQDRRAFEGSDIAQRDLAYDRFYEGHVMYHNSDSFDLCVEKVPTLPLECRLNRDWNCLAAIAHELEIALKK